MRSCGVHAGIVAIALFALYAATSPPTVALEDDGFFILASYFLGVAHPPGYPLFTALGKAATLVPLGTVAYRVHLLSAAFGSLSCAALWLCARALLESRLAAALAALALPVPAHAERSAAAIAAPTAEVRLAALATPALLAPMPDTLPASPLVQRIQELLAEFGDYHGVSDGRANDDTRDAMPGDAAKDRRARFFELRAYLRLEQGDARHALEDLETAVAIWPSETNRARVALADLRARSRP